MGKALGIKLLERIKQIPQSLWYFFFLPVKVAKLQNFVPFQYFPSPWVTQVLLPSEAAALLTLHLSYANTAIFTVLSWFRLNYAETASLSLRICVKTIVFLYVSPGISSSTSRTPARQRAGSTAWPGTVLRLTACTCHPSCTCRGPATPGFGTLCACCVWKRGSGSPGADLEETQASSQWARPHRVVVTGGVLWEGTRGNFLLNWEQIIVPACVSHPVPGTRCIVLQRKGGPLRK